MSVLSNGLQLAAFLLLTLGVVFVLMTLVVALASLLYTAKRKKVIRGYRSRPPLDHLPSTDTQS